MCQQAAYASIKVAMEVLKEKKPKRLYQTLTEEVTGESIRKVLNEKKVCKMKASKRKAWSIRCLRWMVQMPEELLRKDVSLKSTKKELKEWVRKTIPVKGDRILWGQKLTGETKRKRKNGPSRSEGSDTDRQEQDPEKEKEEGLDEDQTEREVEAEQEDQEVRQERSEDRNQHEKCFSRKRLKRKKHCTKQEKLKKS